MKKISLMLLLILCLLFLVSCLGPNNPAPSEAEGTSQFADNSWAGIWSCRYNDRDIAQIVIENETDSGFDFTYYAAEYEADDYVYLADFYGAGLKTTAREAAISQGTRWMSTEVEEIEGFFRLTGDLLEIDYKLLELRSYDRGAVYQTRFQREPEPARLLTPFSFSEIRVMGKPLDNQLIPRLENLGMAPLTVTKFPYIGPDDDPIYAYALDYGGMVIELFKTDDGNYGFIEKITVTEPGFSLCRGLCVGDSMETVISKFPFFDERIEFDVIGGIAKMLYGHAQHMATGGCIVIKEDVPTEIVYSDRGLILFFTLEDEKVKTITAYSEGG
jgi:hypothetical protein